MRFVIPWRKKNEQIIRDAHSIKCNDIERCRCCRRQVESSFRLMRDQWQRGRALRSTNNNNTPMSHAETYRWENQAMELHRRRRMIRKRCCRHCNCGVTFVLLDFASNLKGKKIRAMRNRPMGIVRSFALFCSNGDVPSLLDETLMQRRKSFRVDRTLRWKQNNKEKNQENQITGQAKQHIPWRHSPLIIPSNDDI